MLAFRDFIQILRAAWEIEKQTKTGKLHPFEPGQDEIDEVVAKLSIDKKDAAMLLKLYFIAYGGRSYRAFGTIYKAKYVLNESSKADFRIRVLNNCRKFGYPTGL